MSIVFFIIVIAIITWPYWRKYFYRTLLRVAEDIVRGKMGLPSRKEQERRRKAESKRREREAHDERSGSNPFGFNPFGRNEAYSRAQRRSYGPDEPVIPPEYAEDVEFTEIRGERVSAAGESDSRRRHSARCRESQVEDVEFVEFKTK